MQDRLCLLRLFNQAVPSPSVDLWRETNRASLSTQCGLETALATRDWLLHCFHTGIATQYPDAQPPMWPNEEQPNQPSLEFGPQHTMLARDEFDSRSMMEHLPYHVAPSANIDSFPDDSMQSHGRQLSSPPSTIDARLARRISCPNPRCARTFVGRSELERHLRCTCKFNNEINIRVLCTACTKRYTRKDAMLRHFRKSHSQT